MPLISNSQTHRARVPLIQTARFSLWHYRSDDVLTTITASGSFSPAEARLRAGDLMVMQAAGAVVSTIILAPLMAGVIMGTAIPVSAQVVVRLRDAQGAIIPPTRTVLVEQGYVATTLPTPPSAAATASASRT